ncbi:hypothetical protein ACFLQP_00500 [Acidobacteriota bacterium]
MGLGPLNIVEVWKEVRGELSGATLSELDLSRVLLNGTLCSRFFKSDYLAANFDGSLLHEMSIFPRGHSSFMYSAMYSGDGEKTLSASGEFGETIKEWDVESGQCLKTYKGDLKAEEYPGGTSEKIEIDRDKIIMIYDKTGAPIHTIINIPGLFIQGCSFKNLHPDSDLSEESKNLMRQYGAED